MKSIIIHIFLSSILFASSVNTHQIKILETIISKISYDSDIIVWSDSINILSELKNKSILSTSYNCEEANILVLENVDNLPQECLTKNIFLLDYDLLSKIPKSFGALFWKKGRPNIVILEPRIDAQGIKITKELEPYLEEKVW